MPCHLLFCTQNWCKGLFSLGSAIQWPLLAGGTAERRKTGLKPAAFLAQEKNDANVCFPKSGR